MVYLLAFFTVLLYFVNLGSFQVWSPNEAFYADSARRMLQSGDWLTPYYNGEVRLNKPPMTYWLVSLGYAILGVNEWGLRLMHAILGVGTGLLTMMITRELLGSWRAGALSFLVLTLSLQFFSNSQYASPEVPFTFFITLSLYFWLMYYQKKSLFFLPLAFFASSLAMLVKGPAGFVLPAGVVFLYLLLTDPKELLRLRYYLLTPFALLLGLWWHVYQLITKGGLFWEVFYRENLKRVYHGDEPFYFYFLDLNVSFLPYSLLFFPAAIWVVLKFRREHAFPIVWFSFVYGLFSLIAQKIPVYIMPAFPALAIITAGFLVSSEWTKLQKSLSFLILSSVSLGLLLAVLMLGLDFYYLLLIPIVYLVFYRSYELSPALAGIALLISLKIGLLPELEEHRKVRELGEHIKRIDPVAEKLTYQLGHFHHSLPFYAERKIIREGQPQKGSVVVFMADSFGGCEPQKTLKLYTGSESRLFRFILDTHRGKRFSHFGICLY